MTPRITPPPGPARYDTDLDRALLAFEAAVMRLQGIDGLTKESVRLRCADIHDCRRCRAVRYVEGIDAGFTEVLGAQVADRDDADLPAQVRAALRLVDTLLQHPGAVEGDLRADLHDHFTAVQVVELILTVAKFSVQKALVALRIDEPLGDSTTWLTTRSDGSSEVV